MHREISLWYGECLYGSVERLARWPSDEVTYDSPTGSHHLQHFLADRLLAHWQRRQKTGVHAFTTKADAVPRLQPALVAGFEVPGNLRYHPGHSWALSESHNLVRAGMDDFASKLIGKLESITLLTRGQWIRQGQRMCTIHRNGCAADIVSPMEGTVAEGIVGDPKLALRDPYREGWLMRS